MKINQMSVKNFRGFVERQFDFSDQFNVLIGDNGTGKTAVLDALNIAIGSLFLNFNEIRPRHILPEHVHLKKYELGGVPQADRVYPVVVKCKGIVNAQEISWERTLNSKGGRTTRIGAESIASISKELQANVDKDILFPVLGYYGTGRLWLQKNERTEKLAPPASRLKGYVDSLDSRSNEKMLLAWLYQRQLSLANNKKKPNAQLDVVKQAVAECLGVGYSLEYDFDEKALMIQTPTGQWLPYSYLSDGVHNMLGMVADIAYRAATLNPQLEQDAVKNTPGVILIDEIDLHLHPKWQRNVVDDLRRTFPQIQFFASTHSPFIIQSLRPGELIVLDEKLAGEYVNKPIEDITENLMGVALPQRSERYQRMYEAAKTYYEILQNARGALPKELDAAKRKLDELTAPFSDNVAYHAFLEMERMAAGFGDSKHETR
ncbi:MAG: AAA family ATPase [Anaerolineales bacterium]